MSEPNTPAERPDYCETDEVAEFLRREDTAEPVAHSPSAEQEELTQFRGIHRQVCDSHQSLLENANVNDGCPICRTVAAHSAQQEQIISDLRKQVEELRKMRKERK